MAAYISFALAFCGGFFVAKAIEHWKIEVVDALKLQIFKSVKSHYRKKYNQQMDELVTQYNQQRLALVHRYEGLVAELEKEADKVRGELDFEDTFESEQVQQEATLLIETMDGIREAN